MLRKMFIKHSLKRGEIQGQVPLIKGDLGGSMTSQTTSKRALRMR